MYCIGCGVIRVGLVEIYRVANRFAKRDELITLSRLAIDRAVATSVGQFFCGVASSRHRRTITTRMLVKEFDCARRAILCGRGGGGDLVG